MSRNSFGVILAFLLGCLTVSGLSAAEMPMHHHMDDAEVGAPPAQDSQNPTSANQTDATASMSPDMVMDGGMPGALGDYPMTREASGTSWQPEATPQQGMSFMADQWHVMTQAVVNGIYDNQGGARGGAKYFSSGDAMLMAQRPVGDRGEFGLRSMLSLDPLMGAKGYPLLFATGETADGHNALVDRQHPHDLFMELAGTYSYKLSEGQSAFVYAGLPGEPALGPSAFMHRFSGMDNPEAPIAHHWLDSTHVAFGVVTGGYINGPLKVEASTFRGREPDQFRYDIESPKLDSYATRVTYNPTAHWSFQGSWGYIHSPEQLAPDVNENRVTASGSYLLPFGANYWGTTFAWGRKIDNPGHRLDAFLLESAVVLQDTHTFFARAERVDEDELFTSGSALADQVFSVGKLSVGYIHDFHVAEHAKFGVGGLVSRYDYPRSMDNFYGDNPTSFMIFARIKLI